jgi:hypothetical protein
MTVRFRDEGTRPDAFAHEYAVRCPTCAARAHVTVAREGWRETSAKVVCANCGYNAAWQPGDRRGRQRGIARRRCRNCGGWRERKRCGAPHPYAANLRCAACGAESLETIEWSSSPAATPGDPYFTLPLWYVGRVKGEVFWANNAKHLEFLRNYLGATLRFRTPKINGSAASRLPAFLTDRRNRGAVLKAIEAMSSHRDVATP